MARRVPQLFIVPTEVAFDDLTGDDGGNSTLVLAGGCLADRARIQFHHTQDPECHMCPEIEACQGGFGELDTEMQHRPCEEEVYLKHTSLFVLVFEVEC
ncbi:unnamed protein product [Clonostachys rosea f. rosea IK726]|uniref:Uncharacterized protein n=1 Tax=Clonostachys rosea f. rosea IK726 TaxID=1349383 RepID=A0ACA9TEJ9_BIOOC|nr:unnamed protein product [Clonostachys rosea f. rosea IK726]